MSTPNKISRGLILHKNRILLIHRINRGKIYYVLPGGHSESGESAEETLIREIKEETNLDITISRHMWTFHNKFDNSENEIFLITQFSDNLRLGGPELAMNSKKDEFILEWHDLAQIRKLNLVPPLLKQKIIANFLK